MKKSIPIVVGLVLALLAVAATKMIFQYPNNATPPGSRIVLLDDGAGAYDQSTLTQILAPVTNTLTLAAQGLAQSAELVAATNSTTLASQGMASKAYADATTNNSTGTGPLVRSSSPTIDAATLTGTTTAGAVTATSANLGTAYGLADNLTNSSGFHFADTNAMVAGFTANTNYSKLVTGALATNEVSRATMPALRPNFTGGTFSGFSSASAKYQGLWSITPANTAGTETNISQSVPSACTFTNLYAIFAPSLGASTNCVIALMTNGVASNLTISTVAGNGANVLTLSDTTDGVSVLAGTKVSFKVTGNNPTAYGNNLTLMIQYY